ncbi:MAG: ABC transporter ATP-binding protein [Planctomycetota bacterium]|nr:MAG: ABC transporter ATP-binding protein [Planctomycetota bacterium]
MIHPLLEVKNLSKSFSNVHAVRDLSFRIEAGQIWGFIGPNGAGKTTTMRICSTLELPDHGDVLLDGASILADPNRAHRRIGFMPDALGVYADTTIEEYLDFFARASKLGFEHRKERIASVLAFTDLTDLRERMMDSLSKGMSQRLCLAKTLLHDPDLLILDEPASGLDPRARVEFRELIRALADQGKGVLISSHILSELSETCDGVIVLERGRLVEEGLVDVLTEKIAKHQLLYIRCMSAPKELELALMEYPGIMRVSPDDKGFTVDFDGNEDAIASLLQSLVERKFRPVEFQWRQVGLEEMFLNFTEGTVQ